VIDTVLGAVITTVVLCGLAWMLVVNPQWRGHDARVLALGVVIPFAAVALFVGILLLW
jgi:hypothetical protein